MKWRFSKGLDMKVLTRVDYIDVHSLYEKKREKENGKSWGKDYRN